MSTRTRIAIAGAAGRMGRTLVNLLGDHPGLELSLALEHAGSPHLGADSGQLAGGVANGRAVVSDLAAHTAAFDVLIDFTLPEATLVHVEVCRAAGRPVVVGTTGLGDGRRVLEAAAADIALVFAPNMSIGVNLCFALVARAARVLGGDFDVEIIEAHHRHKIDAPSGTAVRLGEIVADTLGRDLARDAVYGRQGRTGARPAGQIGFATVRGGDLVGDHTVMFIGAGERLEITHRASSRSNYATGALRAARFLEGRRSGLFDMWDVLGLR